MQKDKSINESIITFCGQTAKVNCDRKCHKAWGMHSRPKIKLSRNIDDFAYLADDELPEAPKDPGTYEGGEGKPKSPNDFPNKWCTRECERCNISKPNEWFRELEVKSFDKKIYNIPKKHEKDV